MTAMVLDFTIPPSSPLAPWLAQNTWRCWVGEKAAFVPRREEVSWDTPLGRRFLWASSRGHFLLHALPKGQINLEVGADTNVIVRGKRGTRHYQEGSALLGSNDTIEVAFPWHSARTVVKWSPTDEPEPTVGEAERQRLLAMAQVPDPDLAATHDQVRSLFRLPLDGLVAVAGNPMMPLGLAKLLIEMPSEAVLVALALNPNLPRDFLMMLSMMLPKTVAQNPGIFLLLLDDPLLRGFDDETRRLLGVNVGTR